MEFRIKDVFSQYLRHGEINDYLDYLALKYPDEVQVQTCGRTYENRELKSIRISKNTKLLQSSTTTTTTTTSTATRRKSLGSSVVSMATSASTTKSRRSFKKRKSSSTKASSKSSRTSKTTNTSATVRSFSAAPSSKSTAVSVKPADKPLVLIDGGIHAREWISVATALYCIHQLTENRNRHSGLLDQLDFVIVPVVNADGYEYTHTHSRFWRKTRQPVEGCNHVGADCNRNFDYHWSAACSRASKFTFRGVKPFSEPETNILKSLMHKLAAQCKFYLTLHSHAQAFMYPWGYTRDLPANWQELHRLAQAGHAAIKRQTGKHYRCGSVSLLIKHTAAGGSPDYALGAVKIPYAMCMELSGGGHGFDPPTSAILGLVRESWIGIRAMCAHVGDRVAATSAKAPNAIN